MTVLKNYLATRYRQSSFDFLELDKIDAAINRLKSTGKMNCGTLTFTNEMGITVDRETVNKELRRQITNKSVRVFKNLNSKNRNVFHNTLFNGTLKMNYVGFSAAVSIRDWYFERQVNNTVDYAALITDTRDSISKFVETAETEIKSSNYGTQYSKYITFVDDDHKVVALMSAHSGYYQHYSLSALIWEGNTLDYVLDLLENEGKIPDSMDMTRLDDNTIQQII